MCLGSYIGTLGQPDAKFVKNVLYNYHMPMKKERKQKKLNYRKPELLRYGFVRDLTLAGSAGNPEGGSGKPDKKVGFSDRRLKENILEVGRHPSGIALYLFDFKIQYRDMCGDGRQFGVMADEVELRCLMQFHFLRVGLKWWTITC